MRDAQLVLSDIKRFYPQEYLSCLDLPAEFLFELYPYLTVYSVDAVQVEEFANQVDAFLMSDVGQDDKRRVFKSQIEGDIFEISSRIEKYESEKLWNGNDLLSLRLFDHFSHSGYSKNGRYTVALAEECVSVLASLLYISRNAPEAFDGLFDRTLDKFMMVWPETTATMSRLMLESTDAQ